MQLCILERSWQYDERPDERFGVQVYMWNLGILSGMGDVCEEPRKSCVLFTGGEDSVLGYLE